MKFISMKIEKGKVTGFSPKNRCFYPLHVPEQVLIKNPVVGTLIKASDSKTDAFIFFASEKNNLNLIFRNK